MEYNFTEDIIDVIKQKTSELFNKLDKSINDSNTKVLQEETHYEHFLEDFKLFHNNTRNNIPLLKYIIHKKIDKIEESDNIILFKELKEFENNQEIIESIWDYIHSVYLLHEYALEEPNKEILTVLINKLNKDNKDNTDNANNTDSTESNSLVVVEKNNIDEDNIFEELQNNKEYKMFNNILETMTKNMDIDTSSANTNFINDIMEDIKTNINNSENVDDLFNSTKNISEKYKNMFEDGKITMNDLMSGMMNIISNPKNITESIKDINVNKLPDMNSIMNKLASEVNSNDELKNIMKSDMFKNIKLDPNNKDFNPMDLISTMMSSETTNSADKTDTPLTNEQIVEMENFYSNLNIGKE
jgi:hypothetical protein